MKPIHIHLAFITALLILGLVFLIDMYTKEPTHSLEFNLVEGEQ